MNTTLRDTCRKLGLNPDKTLELTPAMEVKPPPVPGAQLPEELPACIKPVQPLDEPLPSGIKPVQPLDDPLPSGIKPSHPTVISHYVRSTYLRQLFGITELARLPFELRDPQFGSSSVQAISRELTITCTLIDMLYGKLNSLRPMSGQIPHQGDWNMCQQCIKAEREIRNRLLSMEAAGLQDNRRKAA